MEARVNDICIRVAYNDEEYELHTYAGEYRNLMLLIYDKIMIDEFGECRGMGRCGTCLIEIVESNHPLPQLDRNEEATIKKMGVTDTRLRLACQILVDHTIHNLRVRIMQDHPELIG